MRNAPSTLTRTILQMRSTSTVSTVPASIKPLLLKHTSQRPKLFSAAASRVSGVDSARRFPATTTHGPPSSEASAPSFSLEGAFSTSRYPAPDKDFAIAAPIPPVAPVITATLLVFFCPILTSLSPHHTRESIQKIGLESQRSTS